MFIKVCSLASVKSSAACGLHRCDHFSPRVPQVRAWKCLEEEHWRLFLLPSSTPQLQVVLCLEHSGTGDISSSELACHLLGTCATLGYQVCTHLWTLGSTCPTRPLTGFSFPVDRKGCVWFCKDSSLTFHTYLHINTLGIKSFVSHVIDNLHMIALKLLPSIGVLVTFCGDVHLQSGSGEVDTVTLCWLSPCHAA